MKSSFQHELRALINSPLSKRPLFFWLFFPLLYLCSMVWCRVAKLRRKNGYAHRPPQFPFSVVCVGNVLVGGSGKSPVVRAIAREYLRQGRGVAIFCRGRVERSEPIFCSSIETAGALGDEASEHLHLLRHEFGSVANICVVEHKQRALALKHFAKRAVGENWVCLLDDGFQHFAAWRDKNICVWDSVTLFSAPRFCLPVGPYRELGNFFETLPTHIVVGEVTAEQKRALPTQTLFAKVAVQWWSPQHQGLVQLSEDAVRQELYRAKAPLLLSALARPERLVQSIRALQNNSIPLSVIALADHADLEKSMFGGLATHDLIIVPAKNYFYWRSHLPTESFGENKKMLVMGADCTLFSAQGDPALATSVL